MPIVRGTHKNLGEIDMNMKMLDAGRLLHRVTLGVVLLLHSVYLKAVVFSLPGTAAYFSSIGLPGFSAYLVFLVETLAGAALILGFRVRIFSLAVFPILIGATWAHASNGWLFTNSGGGWEYPLVLTAMSATQALLGGGEIAISSSWFSSTETIQDTTHKGVEPN